MTDYANVQDLINLYRPLDNDEQERAQALIPVVCARLRAIAKSSGRDLELMLNDNPDLRETAKSVVVDIVARTLQTPTTGAPMTQASESALGYSFSGSFLNPGGGIFITKAELKALGLKRPRYGKVELMGGGDVVG